MVRCCGPSEIKGPSLRSSAKLQYLRLRRLKGSDSRHYFTFAAVVCISLNGERVFGAELGIYAESGAISVPVILAVLPSQANQMIPVEGIHEDAVIGIASQPAAVLCRSESLLIGAGAPANEPSLRVRRFLGDDVDDTVYGIRPPNGGSGTSNDFDAVDHFQRNLLRIPKDTVEKRGVHGATINHDQELVSGLIVKTPGTDRPCTAIYLCHVQSGNHAQEIRNVRSPERRISS